MVMSGTNDLQSDIVKVWVVIVLQGLCVKTHLSQKCFQICMFIMLLSPTKVVFFPTPLFLFTVPQGTFCTLDICLSRLEDIGTVDIRETVRRMRAQRAFSIQTWDQYYFCYTAVIEYAQRNGKLSPVQWSDTDIDTDSE